MKYIRHWVWFVNGVNTLEEDMECGKSGTRRAGNFDEGGQGIGRGAGWTVVGGGGSMQR